MDTSKSAGEPSGIPDGVERVGVEIEQIREVLPLGDPVERTRVASLHFGDLASVAAKEAQNAYEMELADKEAQIKSIDTKLKTVRKDAAKAAMKVKEEHEKDLADKQSQYDKLAVEYLEMKEVAKGFATRVCRLQGKIYVDHKVAELEKGLAAKRDVLMVQVEERLEEVKQAGKVLEAAMASADEIRKKLLGDSLSPPVDTKALLNDLRKMTIEAGCAQDGWKATAKSGYLFDYS